MKNLTKISIPEVLKNGNTTTNQNIKSEFIGKHVYANATHTTEYILSQDDYKNAPFTFEDVENFYSYPEYYGEYADFSGGSEDQRSSEIERLNELLEETEDTEKREVIENEILELEDLENEPAEILEWWICSDFLIEKLAELGHPVIMDFSLWGRCTSGQAILLDYAITQICANMEILDGQANSWAPKQ